MNDQRAPISRFGMEPSQESEQQSHLGTGGTTMINRLRIYCFAIFLAASLNVLGQENEAAEQQATAKSAKNIIRSLNLPNPDLANDAIEAINDLLKTTRADQGSIYLFVRTVNRNIDELAETCKCANYMEEIRDINRKLMRASYTDSLFQNANLSNQIKTRLPLLIADSVKLNAIDADYPRADFKEELQLLADRFLSSKRFRAGIGLTYSYLPRLTYQATPRVDFSPFQSGPTVGGPDLVVFNTDFSNRSVPALLLSARVPILQVDVAIPDSKHTQTTTTMVQQRDGDLDNDLLTRTTIQSELGIEYDVGLKVSVVDIYNWWQERRGKPATNLQFDYGVGIGISGFEIEDDVSTDVRFRSDPAMIFNDLPAGETITSVDSSSFTTVFVSLHYTFRVSDEFQLGLETRFYQKDQTSDSKVDVDGATFSLSAVWYPTFNW